MNIKQIIREEIAKVLKEEFGDKPKTQKMAKVKGTIVEKEDDYAIIEINDMGDKANLGIDNDTSDEAKEKFDGLSEGDEMEAEVVIKKRFPADEDGNPPEITYDLALRSIKEKLDEMSAMSGGAVEGYAAPLDEDDTIVEYLSEAEVKKKQPRLGKVTRNPAGSNKKFHVYVKCNGRVKKISFGDPGLSIKRDSAARRKNFRARHKCDKAEGKNRCTARYWSCYQWRAGKKVEGE